MTSPVCRPELCPGTCSSSPPPPPKFGLAGSGVSISQKLRPLMVVRQKGDKENVKII